MGYKLDIAICDFKSPWPAGEGRKEGESADCADFADYTVGAGPRACPKPPHPETPAPNVGARHALPFNNRTPNRRGEPRVRPPRRKTMPPSKPKSLFIVVNVWRGLLQPPEAFTDKKAAKRCECIIHNILQLNYDEVVLLEVAF